MPKTYVSDISHYLDDAGELKEMPASVRRMAEFLVAIIDAVTRRFPTIGHDTDTRCRRIGCKSSVLASLQAVDGKITWRCPLCKQNGIISNWQGTKWDQIAAASIVPPKPSAKCTPKEGQYLAFIYYYAKLHRQAPSEPDMQQYFQVTPPVVHNMILKLEKKGFITREPWKTRSIRLLLSREELPELE